MQKELYCQERSCSRNYTISKWNLFCRSGGILSAHLLLSFFPENLRKYGIVFWNVDTEWQEVGRKVFTRKAAGLSCGFGESLLCPHHSGEGCGISGWRRFVQIQVPFNARCSSANVPGTLEMTRGATATGHAGSSVLALRGVSKLPLKQLGLEDTENKGTEDF